MQEKFYVETLLIYEAKIKDFCGNYEQEFYFCASGGQMNRGIRKMWASVPTGPVM